MTKRIVTRLFSLAVIISSCCAVVTAPAAEWYKGELHCHSLWSDGDTLPELVLDWYRADGFQFIALTDHSTLQIDINKWKAADPVLIQESRAKFGDDWLETKEDGDKTLVHLKTIRELRDQFNKDGSFLVIPGMEQNAGVAGRTLHAISANISETIPFPANFPSTGVAARQWRQNAMENAEKNGNVGFWMINHTDWPYYDIPPSVLIETPEIEFLEYNISSPPTYIRPNRHPLMPAPEKYWDIVIAFRLLENRKPVFLVATDDTHCYRVFKDNGVNPGHGWVGVRSEKLDADALFSAMKQGDFYSSTGVEMKDIRFDSESRTLYVDVKPEDGVKYSVRFVGTKKGFDTKTESFEDPAKDQKPARTGLIYSDDIGVTLKVEDGVSTSCKMVPEDLYVRAIVTSDKKPKYRDRNEPPTATAWTQPYGW